MNIRTYARVHTRGDGAGWDRTNQERRAEAISGGESQAENTVWLTHLHPMATTQSSEKSGGGGEEKEGKEEEKEEEEPEHEKQKTKKEARGREKEEERGEGGRTSSPVCNGRELQTTQMPFRRRTEPASPRSAVGR